MRATRSVSPCATRAWAYPPMRCRAYSSASIASRARVAGATRAAGIGLALVQELVRLHGGTIEAHSTVGKGSEFVVAIPKGSGHLPADHVVPRGRRSGSPSRAATPMSPRRSAGCREPRRRR
jgi:hypothetical protein